MGFFINTVFPFVVIVLGLIYIIEKTLLKPRRNKIIHQIESTGNTVNDEESKIINKTGFMVNLAVEWFPLLGVVFFFRAFLFEPFQIPSGSMTPTLFKGDFILVNKHSYGLINPFTGSKILDISEPKRGDPIVFKYPLNPEIDYIKRVVGLPGETVYYENKKVIVKNENKVINFRYKKKKTELDRDTNATLEHHIESFGEESHIVVAIDKKTNELKSTYFKQEGTGITEFVVPQDHYFVMGDNRDDSLDSRFWGFVHKEAIKGRAAMIWLSVERDNKEDMLPSSIRLERIGLIN